VPRAPKILLFDIDGTLLLTGGAGKPALERAFEELFGVPDAWGEVEPHGKTDPLIIQEIARTALGRALEAAEIERLTDRYHHYFESELKKADRFRLMPGVEALLAALARETGLHLGIATGTFERAARLKLERGGLGHHFRFGGFGSDSPDRFVLTLTAYKRAEALLGLCVPAARVFVIGDTHHDILAGKRLGARTVAVATGNASEKELRAFGPDFTFPDFADTRRFLDCVLGRD
jgi:phosphoglycolate phosphatase-like HAD superfamily hydrolase